MTVAEVIEEVKTDICDNYCKYRDRENESDEEFDAFMDEYCDKCPLNRL